MLHDNHCTINDQTKIDGTQRHQIATDAKQAHHANGEEHRQGNHRGHNQASPDISEHQHQHEDHNQCTLDQVCAHRTDGTINKGRPVQVGLDGDSLGKRLLDLGDPTLDVIDHIGRVRTLEHIDDTAHGLAIVVVGEGSVSHGRSIAHNGNIRYTDGKPLVGPTHDDLLKIGIGGGHSLGADVGNCRAALDVRSARVSVVVIHLLGHIGNGQAHRSQAIRINGYLDLPQKTAEGGNVCHAAGT